MTKLMNCHGCDDFRVTFSIEKELGECYCNIVPLYLVRFSPSRVSF